MAAVERKPAKEAVQKPAKSKAFQGFTHEERAAMRERVQELKAAARRGPRLGKADGESAVLAKIAAMPAPDRTMAVFNSLSAKAVGHMAPSSGFAWSLTPNVAYLVLNFCARS